MTNSIAEELAAKTLRELAQSEKSISRSRISNTPNGYIHLVAWSNLSLLRVFVRKFTNTLPKTEFRLKAQMDDAARSAVSTLEEGFGRPTTSEYLTFLGFSEASLLEIKGDIHRCRQDNLLKSKPGTYINSLGIDMGNWHNALKQSAISKPNTVKGFYGNLEELKKLDKESENQGQNPSNHFRFLYPQVDDLKGTDLTYEIFIELVNKSSWHLRKLVFALENKLNQDQKFYQVEQARIKSKIKMK